MKTKKIVVLFALVIGLLACKKNDVAPQDGNNEATEVVDNTTVDNNTSDNNNNNNQNLSDTLYRGTFSGSQHDLAGEVVVYKNAEGNVLLKLKSFTMTSAPDANLYLSKTTSFSDANVIKLADLTDAYVKDELTYDIDDQTDFNTYKSVLVYCYQYSAMFGYTTLTAE